jgi:hypothetical protein
MSAREDATAAMSTSDAATGTMSAKVGNVAAAMSTPVPAPVPTAVPAAASESVSSKRQAAERENRGQCKDRFAHKKTSSTVEGAIPS